MSENGLLSNNGSAESAPSSSGTVIEGVIRARQPQPATPERPALTQGSSTEAASYSHDLPVRLLRPSELLSKPARPHLIRGLLPLEGLGVMYGPPETWKTFLSLDMSFCIATGTPWHGHHVQPGHVIYVAAEGSDGLTLRMRAWLAGHAPELDQVVEKNVRFISGPLSFLATSFEGICNFLVMVAKGNVRLVVIDTLSRCFVGGDESQASDMNIFVNRCDQLRRGLGATVLVIHHTSRDGEERGSTVLRAAADTMLRTDRHGNVVTLTCNKQKDGEHSPGLAFQLQPVDVAQDEQGNKLTSCRIVQTVRPSVHQKRTTAAAVRIRVALALRDACGGEPASAEKLRQVTAIPRSTLASHLRALVKEGCVTSTGRGKATRYAFVRLPVAEEGSVASNV